MHRGSRKLSITTAVAIAFFALSAVALRAAPLAKTSHAHFWGNKPGSVFCATKSKHKPAALVCRGTNVPGGGVKKCVSGGFAIAWVFLEEHGKPTIKVTCKNQFPTGGHVVFLPGGTTWKGLGITCKLTGANGKTVTCTNKSHHGFKTGNGKYKAF